KDVERRVEDEMCGRIGAATEYLQERVKRNLSTPVEYEGGRVRRSKPGEYPRMETGMLRESIQSRVRRLPTGDCEGEVETSLYYGIILERSDRPDKRGRVLDRVFLRRTLREELGKIRSMVSGPMR